MNTDAAPRIAGFIPARDARATIGEAVRCLRAQAPLPLEVLVVDDGSGDDTAALAVAAGARAVRQPSASGRGAARARGVELLETDFIVSLDSGNRVGPDFLARALPLFDDPRVGAVVGAWSDPAPAPRLARRWRARHLFKIGRQPPPGSERHLATHGCVLRRAAVLDAGNFDPALRHTEDAKLGWLMRQRGWRILASDAAVEPQRADGLAALARRYWRWHAGTRERWTLAGYLAQLRNSLLVMAPLDVRARDWPALLFTLCIPHWTALITLARRLSGRVQR